MFIDEIKIDYFRNFASTRIDFVHPDRDFSSMSMPRPNLANINLVLGNNGFGKTTLLKAIALTCLGPAVRSSGIFPYRLVRREPGLPESPSIKPATRLESVIEARFTAHDQDDTSGHPVIESRIRVVRKGDLEELDWAHPEDKPWHPIFSESSAAFFFVGYGATRRVEKREQFDGAARQSSSFIRAQRVQSLFEEAYSLIPLSSWLPKLEATNRGRFTQVHHLINLLMGEGHYEFTGEMESDEYLFVRDGMKVPFRAMSDGYRAYLGWIGDLLYHVCATCPNNTKLVDHKGIVMVDEIDLHLHPQWQMNVLATLSQSLPNIQFILTSHSPLLVGSLEWMNLIVMQPDPNPHHKQASEARRIEQGVHGLDADQVLLTDFFGLTSTRAESKERRLKKLTQEARGGDAEAALRLLDELSKGSESGDSTEAA